MKITLALSQLEILKQVDQLKLEIDGLRPLSKEQEGRIFQKFRLDWNYHSNAIEGNSLTYGETRALLLYGLTAKGKPFKDHLDIKGHNEAIDFLLALVKDVRPLSEQDIREMHKLVLKEPYRSKAQTEDGQEVSKMINLGAYKTTPNHVQTPTGEIHYYATPEETPAKMTDLMDWYNEASRTNEVHPVVLAALFHYRFVAIHPFDDGNGRMARLLMNLILMRYDYPPVVIRQDKDSRNQYYLALSQADAQEYTPFTELVIEALLHSMNIYIKGAKGEDINEPDDLDKELALFRKELEGEKHVIEAKLSRETTIKTFEGQIKPILKIIRSKQRKFFDLFLEQNFFMFRNLNDYNQEVYDKFESFEALENAIINQILVDNYSKIILGLVDFKFGINQFTTTTAISFSFYELEYKIQYNNIEILKFYDKPITENEKENFASKIGNDILTEIKSKYKTSLKNDDLSFLGTEPDDLPF